MKDRAGGTTLYDKTWLNPFITLHSDIDEAGDYVKSWICRNYRLASWAEWRVAEVATLEKRSKVWWGDPHETRCIKDNTSKENTMSEYTTTKIYETLVFEVNDKNEITILQEAVVLIAAQRESAAKSAALVRYIKVHPDANETNIRVHVRPFYET